MNSKDPNLQHYWQQQRNALSEDVLLRLRAARIRALEANPQFQRFRVPGWSLPAGVLAATVLLGLGVWWARPVSDASVRAADQLVIEDAELLASNEDPGLYAEDPEFLAWSQSQLGQERLKNSGRETLSGDSPQKGKP